MMLYPFQKRLLKRLAELGENEKLVLMFPRQQGKRLFYEHLRKLEKAGKNKEEMK